MVLFEKVLARNVSWSEAYVLIVSSLYVKFKDLIPVGISFIGTNRIDLCIGSNFGLYDREEVKSILLGLSVAFPDYINVTFTNDLQSISLSDKTSEDVLKLF